VKQSLYPPLAPVHCLVAFVYFVSFVVPSAGFAGCMAEWSHSAVWRIMNDHQPLSTDNALDELRSRYGELAALAGSLAHEIKNPLSVIRMNMDLLGEDFADPATPKERRALAKIEMVSRQCTRLENLLNDFLRFNKVNQLELTLGSLNEQIERVLDLFAAQAAETHVEVVRYLDPDLPSIQLNAETLQAALVNLVKNALEAMPDGGQLTARTRVTRQGVALDLIDTGIGMDERTAMKMFDAFYTTKSGGSGLGLPTARRIIEAHGGRIGVHSEVGIGTQFTLEFPVPARIGGDGSAEVGVRNGE
jgi:signal transduction histidine kinase